MKVQIISILYFMCGFVMPADEALNFPKTLYSISTEYKPAFCSLLINPFTGEYDLGFSSFSGFPNELDNVLRIPSVSQNYLDKTKMVTQEVTDKIFWPNEIEAVPYGTFESRHYWTSASAFFLPGKDDGSISLIDMTDPINPGQPIKISSTEEGKKWYYHRVVWHDMDYDGDYDAVTARAYGNSTTAVESQLLWFENPGITPPPENWNAHVVSTGYEDVHFRLHNLPLPDGEETAVLVSAGFFSRSLTLTWSTDRDWTNPDSIQHRVIDSAGWYFDIQIEDLNADGKVDILITTWSRPGPDIGSLLAYEMPAGDWRTDDWIRHYLSTDFHDDISPGSGSPGAPAAFWPSLTSKQNGEKAHLLVSGDDDGQAYLLVPNYKNDVSDWSYTKSTIFRTFGTVGTMAIGDIDGDGYTEIFIPAYTTKQIIVLTYKP